MRNLNWLVSMATAAVLVLPPAVNAVAAAGTAEADTKLARDFEHDIRKQLHDPAVPLIDVPALMERVEANIPASKDVKEGFAEGAGTFGDAEITGLIQQIANGGNWTFVRINQRKKESAALFRLDLANGAVNYLEWYIGTDAHGDRRFVDAYDVGKGEMVSQTLRRIYLAAVITTDKNAAQNMSAHEQELVSSLGTLKEMTTATGQGKYQAVLDAYKTLPDSVKHEKNALFLRVAAANALAPNDPASDLLGIDHLFQIKDWTAAHQALARLNAFTGGDAHLDCMDGQAYLAAGTPKDMDSAIDDYNTAMKLEPTNPEAYWGLVTVYLAQKDYQKTSDELHVIEDKLKLQVNGDLSSIPVYADFAKSKQGKAWAASHKAAAAPAAK